jgi:hypothetical protein
MEATNHTVLTKVLPIKEVSVITFPLSAFSNSRSSSETAPYIVYMEKVLEKIVIILKTDKIYKKKIVSLPQISVL